MVSPRKDHVDVENRTRFGSDVAPNLSGIKSSLLQKPSTLPLGDVRNTLGSAGNILKSISEEVSKTIKKDSELKPSKSIQVPVNIVQEKVEELPDPVWDAPLAYKGFDDDSYCDILPQSLQLTHEDIMRFVLNKPGPRTGLPMFKWNDDVDRLPSPEILYADFYCETLGYEDILDSDDDLPAVPPLSDSEDGYSDHEF